VEADAGRVWEGAEVAGKWRSTRVRKSANQHKARLRAREYGAREVSTDKPHSPEIYRHFRQIL